MAKVIYSPEAEADLIEISGHIILDSPNAARRWIAKIRDKCELHAAHPNMGERRPDFGDPNCRSFSVGNYVVIFRPLKDGIEVARIIHGSRDIRRI